MASNKPKFYLQGGNWNCANPIFNNSAEMQNLLTRGANEIFDATVTDLQARGAVTLSEAVRASDAPPTSQTKIRVRFVSHPSLAWEMRYNSLKGGLDGAAE